MNPGDVIGPYLIVGKLGEGGMGEVYRARVSFGARFYSSRCRTLLKQDARRLAARELKILLQRNRSGDGAIIREKAVDFRQQRRGDRIPGVLNDDLIRVSCERLDIRQVLAVTAAPAGCKHLARERRM